MNIYLIGYRCTGKTRVGRELAANLGRRFFDADEFLVQKEKMEISAIVSRFGWPAFREKEARVLGELGRKENSVIATGGGVVLRPDNIRYMKKNGGIIIWLKATAETILSRMAADAKTPENRPPLSDRKLAEEVVQTLQERMPLYEQAMDFSIDTENKSISAIVCEIEDQLR